MERCYLATDPAEIPGTPATQLRKPVLMPQLTDHRLAPAAADERRPLAGENGHFLNIYNEAL